jgi:hypothetical protein
MSLLRRLLREPLLHFAAVGAALFLAYVAVKGGVAEPNPAIVVDRRSLLAFMQYRANAFEPSVFSAALDGMSDSELDALVAAYVDDEIMYRQAEELGLGASDYVIRQRMIQKADFLLGDAAAATLAVDDAELRAYFEAHKDAYAIASWVTFTHVFFDADRRGDAAAHADAEEAAQRLTSEGARFEDAVGQGDRFPYLTNYVERTLDYVASHFGGDFAAALAKLTPASAWQGPIRSAYGEHVVLLTAHTERRYPEFEDVRDAVKRDYVDMRTRAERAKMLEGLRRLYHVEVRNLREQ